MVDNPEKKGEGETTPILLKSTTEVLNTLDLDALSSVDDRWSSVLDNVKLCAVSD